MFFDDFAPGQRFTTATCAVSEGEILAFAQQYDPQPFHTDVEAANASIFGGLIASGFQTVMIAFRLVLEANIWNEASQGSPGIEDLRWLKPVRPGDTLQVAFEVITTRASSRHTDRGYVTWDYIITNQHAEVVCTWRSTIITLRDPAKDRAAAP